MPPSTGVVVTNRTASYTPIGHGDYTTSAYSTPYISIDAIVNANEGTAVQGSMQVTKKQGDVGYQANIIFKLYKKKMSILEGIKATARIKKLERLIVKSIEDGQDALAEKFIKEFTRETRETALYARGIRKFISREFINKYKYKIRSGKISDTQFEKYTRVIPKDVLKKKKAVEDLFDGFVIYHYWNENQEDVKKMSEPEKTAMRDPILFGQLNGSDRLYFIADWDDELCHLTFDELIDALEVDDEKYITIPATPAFDL